MSENKSHIDNLTEIRSVLVEQRRYVISREIDLREVNKSHDDPFVFSGVAQEIKSLQEKIEAVDKAIADEKAMIKPTTWSSPI